ncbi:MAG: Sua5/YciO/YrdC/YwlC family protein [Methylococcales bacterium]
MNLPKIRKTWPGPVTWLIKARSTVPIWLQGSHESVAARDSRPVALLCQEFGKPLVSRPANPSAYRPARTLLQPRL